MSRRTSALVLAVALVALALSTTGCDLVSLLSDSASDASGGVGLVVSWDCVEQDDGVRLDCDGTVRGLDAGVVPSWRWKPQHLNESTQPPPVRFDWSRYCATRPSAGEQRVTVDVSVIADGEAVSGSKTFTVCAPSTS